MRQLGGTIKKSLDVDFQSTRDDNLEPRSVCGRVCQGLQDAWSTLSAGTLFECVNDEDEAFLGGEEVCG